MFGKPSSGSFYDTVRIGDLEAVETKLGESLSLKGFAGEIRVDLPGGNLLNPPDGK